MSGRTAPPRRDGAFSGGERTRVVAGSLLALAVAVLATLAAWPVYDDTAFVFVAVAGTVAGAAVAACALRLRWGGWTVTVVLGGVFLLIGVLVAVPSRLTDPGMLPRAIGDVLTGAVVGWKDLLTVDLPVGSYRNLLVPALVVFLAGTSVLLLSSWRRDRLAFLAVPVAVGMVGFGLLFGRTSVSASLVVGQLTLAAPLETMVGASTMLVLLLWLVWRDRAERSGALARARGARIGRRASGGAAARGWTAVGLLALAVVVAVAVVPWAAQGLDRDVLRGATAPDVDLSAEISPLASYRAAFDDDRVDEVLFRVAVLEGAPERVRVAVLDGYDGEVFRTDDDTRFVRVPSARTAQAGARAVVDVEIVDLDAVWMPIIGDLVEVSFVGERAAALADGFYYSAQNAAAVETAGGGLRAGDAYRLEASLPGSPATFAAPGSTPGVGAPESLRVWVDEHRTGTDGAALIALIDLLRERGYLSHALTDGDVPARWMQDLDDYRFQPAAAGHSLARIDQMFSRLLQREADPQAIVADNFVAAVGDDEQFAVAAALIAEELGYPARVVVGARLAADDPSLPVCEDGVCTAGDLSAWIEVRTASGAWVAIDTTPQHERSPNLETTEQRDPENVTDVRPDAVEEVVPPDPTQEDEAVSRDDEETAAWDLAWLWPILRVVAIWMLVALLLLGPFLVILAAKALRRRGRRRAATPADRIAAGWEEVVDAAADAGYEPPGARTRSETAALWELPDGVRLAAAADEATFSGRGATTAQAQAFWDDVDRRRRDLRSSRGVWRALMASVSLRSFIRRTAPGGARRHLAERGERGSSRRARTMP
ncbi:transglutaminase domain-containing protein [Microbacterium xanthum]|uniref:transglutaminase domain-containing protein n=1 Tax=Microbacterium xanthum TaxID=3079794 RepID=UPI002AD5A547|nr:transglutaminase domain-containing protein [Microbacterium sp. KSW-48]MDZ8170585.1 transglutaminase domain-containing protein [Microbacterium sp. KSW-48]